MISAKHWPSPFENTPTFDADGVLETHDSCGMTESKLEALAKQDPRRFCSLIKAGMPPGLLTFALEIAGRERELKNDLAMATILPFADHEFALVREGVACGLAYRNHTDSIATLRKLSSDSHLAVQVAAQAALEDLGVVDYDPGIVPAEVE